MVRLVSPDACSLRRTSSPIRPTLRERHSFGDVRRDGGRRAAASGNMSLKSGEMFPCMDCPCGCNSAEQCWRSCCCHTLAERMDWAREHGVRPPEYAIDEARRQRIDLCWLDEPAGSQSGKDLLRGEGGARQAVLLLSP